MHPFEAAVEPSFRLDLAYTTTEPPGTELRRRRFLDRGSSVTVSTGPSAGESTEIARLIAAVFDESLPGHSNRGRSRVQVLEEDCPRSPRRSTTRNQGRQRPGRVPSRRRGEPDEAGGARTGELRPTSHGKGDGKQETTESRSEVPARFHPMHGKRRGVPPHPFVSGGTTERWGRGWCPPG